MEQSSNVVQFPGAPQEPAVLAALHGLVGMPQWRPARRGWEITVLARDVVANAVVRRSSTGRWMGEVVRSPPKGRRRWETDAVVDVASLREAMSAAERSIARLAASPV